MDPRCRVELFGGLRLIQDGGALVTDRFRTRKAAALLAYLALHRGRAHAREVLLELLWPDKDEKAGRDNLSTALASLRRQLEPPGSGIPPGGVLSADWQSVRLNPAAVSTDLQAFESGLEAAARPGVADGERARLLGAAIAEYRGELLPGFYDEWALQEQGRLAGRYADALEQWGQALARSGDPEAAVEAYRRCIEADPLREEAYRERMRLLCVLGRPRAAKELYAELARALREELDAAPAPATRRLLSQIESDPDALRAPAPEPPPAAAPSPPAHPGPGEPSGAAPRVFLPLQLTRFVGREPERGRLASLLTGGDGVARLVTLLGPGGVGKTRLSVEAARAAAGAFPGGVWFVSLADIPAGAFLPGALAGALQVSAGTGDLVERVVTFLNGDARPKLLVLDNFEHLLAARFEPAGGKSENPSLRGAAAVVRLLLDRAPGLCCLVTSRQPLGIGGEVQFPIGPLAPPEDAAEADRDALLALPSIALFVDRARAAVPDFALTAANAEPVADICRRLEGIPLAIEMAATWVKTFPPARLRDRLGEGLTRLSSRRRDLPARHETLNGAVGWSYGLLPPELQATFRRLSVFRGGWSPDRAEALLGDDLLNDLADLQDRSLVVATEAPSGQERYRLLEPIREYAAERLAEDGEADPWRARHAAAFLGWAAASGDALRGPEQGHWFGLFDEDHDNLRVALDFALRPDAPDDLRQTALAACQALFWFWKRRGHIREGTRWHIRALEVTASLPPSRARAAVANGAGSLFVDHGEFDQARSYFRQSLDLYTALGDVAGVAVALGSLASVSYHQGDHAAATAYADQGITLARAHGEDRTLATLLGNISRVYVAEGDLERARALRAEALALQRACGDRAAVAIQLNNLAGVASMQGEYEAARVYLREALAINRELQNRDSAAFNLYTLGETELLLERYAEARGCFLAALRAWAEVDNRPLLATALECLGRTDVAEGTEHARAARLFGAAEQVRSGPPLMPRQSVEEPPYREATAAAQAALGDAVFRAHVAAGAGLAPSEAAGLLAGASVRAPE